MASTSKSTLHSNTTSTRAALESPIRPRARVRLTSSNQNSCSTAHPRPAWGAHVTSTFSPAHRQRSGWGSKVQVPARLHTSTATKQGEELLRTTATTSNKLPFSEATLARTKSRRASMRAAEAFPVGSNNVSTVQSMVKRSSQVRPGSAPVFTPAEPVRSRSAFASTAACVAFTHWEPRMPVFCRPREGELLDATPALAEPQQPPVAASTTVGSAATSHEGNHDGVCTPFLAAHSALRCAVSNMPLPSHPEMVDGMSSTSKQRGVRKNHSLTKMNEPWFQGTYASRHEVVPMEVGAVSSAPQSMPAAEHTLCIQDTITGEPCTDTKVHSFLGLSAPAAPRAAAHVASQQGGDYVHAKERRCTSLSTAFSPQAVAHRAMDMRADLRNSCCLPVYVEDMQAAGGQPAAVANEEPDAFLPATAGLLMPLPTGSSFPGTMRPGVSKSIASHTRQAEAAGVQLNGDQVGKAALTRVSGDGRAADVSFLAAAPLHEQVGLWADSSDHEVVRSADGAKWEQERGALAILATSALGNHGKPGQDIQGGDSVKDGQSSNLKSAWRDSQFGHPIAQFGAKVVGHRTSHSNGMPKDCDKSCAALNASPPACTRLRAVSDACRRVSCAIDSASPSQVHGATNPTEPMPTNASEDEWMYHICREEFSTTIGGGFGLKSGDSSGESSTSECPKPVRGSPSTPIFQKSKLGEDVQPSGCRSSRGRSIKSEHLSFGKLVSSSVCPVEEGAMREDGATKAELATHAVLLHNRVRAIADLSICAVCCCNSALEQHLPPNCHSRGKYPSNLWPECADF
jgi:hypothetical protein